MITKNSGKGGKGGKVGAERHAKKVTKEVILGITKLAIKMNSREEKESREFQLLFKIEPEMYFAHS